ncbi:hypothetical protein C2E20_1129 [Micractinium conductrix]|uniref:Uncharacterized protein n=1 Tax=Micractinium conductrix TaxID=554055 RepID=A0A2P6VN76_9CHLO|nr:hypothetical protein C2E20_1129 [Micractinium conductrix]|eukprot:PSC75507.1 hypothetical protein C2E20_1129 [Micractinium conductrix]
MLMLYAGGGGWGQLRRAAGTGSAPAQQQQRARCRGQSLPVAAELGSRSGSGGSSGDGGEPRRRAPGRRARKARAPGLFEVQDLSPPPQSLGIHALPPNTHNGDQIELDGAAYVVQSVVLQYRLVRGKYRRDHARLEVRNTGRMLANLFLEELYQREGPPGADGEAGGPAR